MKRFIKRLLFIVTIVLAAVACSLDNDDNNDFTLRFIPIEYVTTPDYVTPGETYPVTMYFRRQNDCYYVSEDPYFEISGTTMTVAVQAVLIEHAECLPIDYTTPETKAFNFQCPITAEREFTFKFYQGLDDQGANKYLEVRVPVQQ
jgi:thioredoxin-related protein